MRSAAFVISCAVISSLLSVGLFQVGLAQPGTPDPAPVVAVDAASMPVDMVPASAPVVEAKAEPAPASVAVHDPVEDPSGFVSDMKAAKNKGWPLAAAMFLFVALRFASKRFAILRKGKYAAYAAGGLAVLGSCVDALATGASWTPVMVAAMGAAMLAMDPGAKVPAVEPEKPAA